MNNLRTKIIYPEEEAELCVEYAKMKGCLSSSRAELPGGSQYPLCFYELESIKYELGNSLNFLAEPGLVILKVFTKEFMEEAVEKLYQQGYFDHLKPCSDKMKPRRKWTDSRTIFHDYMKAKGRNIKEHGGVPEHAHDWFLTKIDGTRVRGRRDFYNVEATDGKNIRFETVYDQKRGGVLAVIAPNFQEYEIIIPNDQIAEVIKEEWKD